MRKKFLLRKALCSLIVLIVFTACGANDAKTQSDEPSDISEASYEESIIMPPTLEEAEEKVNNWLAGHPFGLSHGGVSAEMVEYGIDRKNHRSFIFPVWVDGEESFEVYVYRDDGTMIMEYYEYDSEIDDYVTKQMPIDQWYDEVYLSSLPTAPDNAGDAMALFEESASAYLWDYIIDVIEYSAYEDSVKLNGGLSECFCFDFTINGALHKACVEKTTGYCYVLDDDDYTWIDYWYMGWIYSEEAFALQATDSGFDRTVYYTGITRTDLLRYPDNYLGSYVKFGRCYVLQVLDEKVYVVNNGETPGSNYIIVDDRNNSGANALEGDLVTVFGSFSGNVTYGTSPAPVVTADRMILNNVMPTDFEELAQALVYGINHNRYLYKSGETTYLGGASLQWVMAIYGTGGSRDLMIYDHKLGTPLNETYVPDVDGYAIYMKFQLAEGLIDPISAGAVVPGDFSEIFPIRVNGTLVEIKQNPINPCIYDVTFIIESFEPYDLW